MKRALIVNAGLLAVLLAWLAFRPSGHVRHPPDAGERSLSQAASPIEAPDQTRQPARTPAAESGDGDASQASAGQPPVPVTSPASAAAARRSITIGSEWVAELATGSGNVSFALPDGRTASGVVEMRRTAADGSPVSVSGQLSSPGKGRFSFQVQPPESPSGPVFGVVVIDREETAFRVLAGPGQTSALTELSADEVICRSYIRPPEEIEVPQEIPADHPTGMPIPDYQNGIIPLQSSPGAPGVIYLDFDGQTGPHEYWGSFDAAAPNVSNTVIKDVWTRVCEDFAPFNLNVTTDLQVFLNASETSRQRCIITPTTTAAPGAGGVAVLNTFSSAGDIACWSFYSSGKNAAEVISHEIGHTLGLYHDGRTSPGESYYLGQGTDPVGWAPIMGAAYYKNLSQWSKGEYLSANQLQDDIAIIAANPNVGIRTDDSGATHAAAIPLEIFTGGAVNSQGTIETQGDVDAFRFTTSGGPVNLSVSPVAAGPNLDILASICNASGVALVSQNPDTALNASLTTTLSAGEYTIRVDGSGRGSALVDGYTEYGSIGQFTITGTIDGALVPDRFNVAENPPTGTVVGTPVPRNNHGGAALTYSITAGNTGSAFAIHPSSGVITVATPSALDFEALSNTWSAPPAVALTVLVTDSINAALNESLRVVIHVTDVNEPPVISGPATLTVISHTVSATPLASVTGSDPDAFDFPVYSIASGNLAGKFAISPTGQITVAGDLDASQQSTYPLVIRATDHGSPGLTADLAVTVTVIPASPAFSPGFIYQTIYGEITGSTISSLTASPSFPTSPTGEIQLGEFTATTRGDDYGSTVRTWMIAPYTGRYQFWISGDQIADLYFSSAGNPSATTRICYLTSPTSYQQWSNSGSTQSTSFNLTAGQACYLEVRHKESTGNDHLSVAWQIRNSANTSTIVSRSVIPGRYLSPHRLNYGPKVVSSSVNLHRGSYAGTTVATMAATDLNPQDSHTWSITGGNAAGIFGIDPATGRVSVANSTALAANASASISLTVMATDNGTAPLSGSGTITVNFLDTGSPPTAGLYQEFWDNVNGTNLTSLYSVSRYPDRPDRIANLTAFDSGSGLGDSYGARIRAYVIPPATGSYTFYLASDNNGALFLSPDSDPANATQVATVATFTSYQSWTTYPAQASAPVTLTAGQRYFIEGRVKESSAGDHLSVAWTGPSISAITLIGDDSTEPYDSNIAPSFAAGSYAFGVPAGYVTGTSVGSVVAADSPFDEIRYAVISGDPHGALAVNPVTGEITVANPANLSAGYTYHLQIGAQDSGHGRRFAPRATLVPVAVTVPGTNTPPVFAGDPVNLGSFPAAAFLSASIASAVSDPGDVIRFSKVSGPSWLSVSSNGLLSGTPDFTQFGPHVLVVTADDERGHVVQGNVAFTVAAPAAVSGTSLTPGSASASLTTGSVTSGNATSASSSNNAYLVLRESSTSGTSALEYRWTFPTPASRQAVLRVEAHHTANSESDNFRFAISTNGGSTFTDAVLVNRTSDDNSQQVFAFNTGTGSSTIIRVIDTNRSNGSNSLDSLSIDLLAIEFPGNSAPTLENAAYQIVSHAPAGTVLGSVAASDPDAGQTLSFSLARGNEAGFFAISPAGVLSLATPPPSAGGTFELILAATDNGVPVLANYATITVEVIPSLLASVTLTGLNPTYDGNPKTVGVTVDPPWLTVSVTYNGSPDPPTDSGTYGIVASVQSPTHSGSATGSLVIAKAAAEITIRGLSQAHDGTPKPVEIEVTPAGLPVTVTYDGLTEAPAAAGSYAVLATVDDGNHSGSATATLVIRNNLIVAEGQTIITSDPAPAYQTLINDGTLVLGSGTLQIATDAINNGTLRLIGDARLDVSGSFTNTGFIDIINWTGTLPPELVNSGTIIDRSDVRVLSTGHDPLHFRFTVPGFDGHLYQLESAPSPAVPWTPLGGPIPGGGSLADPPQIEFSPAIGGGRDFFRVRITPAP